MIFYNIFSGDNFLCYVAIIFGLVLVVLQNQRCELNKIIKEKSFNNLSANDKIQYFSMSCPGFHVTLYSHLSHKWQLVSDNARSQLSLFTLNSHPLAVGTCKG